MEGQAPVNRRRFMSDVVALGCGLLGSVTWAVLSRSSPSAETATSSGIPATRGASIPPGAAEVKNETWRLIPNPATSPKRPPLESDYWRMDGNMASKQNIRYSPGSLRLGPIPDAHSIHGLPRESEPPMRFLVLPREPDPPEFTF